MGLINLAFLLMLGSLVAALGKDTNPGWLLLNLALLGVMGWLSVLPHEAGHALVARLVGLGVHRITLGIGREIVTLTLLGVPIEIRRYPAGGVTHIAARQVPHIRWKWALIVVAGPLVNVLMLWAALSWGETAWRAERIEGGLAPVCTFIAANVLTLVGNLWPMRAVTEDGVSATDGAQLLWLASGKQYDFAAAERRQHVARAQHLFRRGQWHEMVLLARRQLESDPTDVLLRIQLSAALIQLGELLEARKLLEAASDGELWNEPHRAALANNLAWIYLLADDEQLGERAKELATFAYEWLPWEAAIASTYGCAHAFFGDADVAMRILMNERVQRNSDSSRASSLAGLAVAQCRLGRADDAQSTLESAMIIKSDAALLDLAKRKLGGMDTLDTH